MKPAGNALIAAVLFMIIVCLVVILSSRHSPIPIADQITYTEDTRTHLCFAWFHYTGHMVTVPCTTDVERLATK